ncbi:hypothetical protein ELI56_02370 [Rhizobium ruizarguesonis]|uniref:hypothetical protein n=1 Tax=Rhizobium ruizarguesonis TaxID=2081791 RepID=UPI0010302B94|nr:hypothetical protein [Rhizobium ruizarguesonis]TAT77141.1 hypothetical protein ELI56_02370 [Rhizobium ruizarguesonis]
MKHPKWVTRYREFMYPPRVHDPLSLASNPELRHQGEKIREGSRAELMGSYASTYRQLGRIAIFVIAVISFVGWAILA